MSRSDSDMMPGKSSGMERRRRAVESIATFGLILVAVGLAAPFASMTDTAYISIFKWVYAPGALIFTVARVFNVSDPDESLRLRRLRRLEFWAGVSFCIGAFFWFYNDAKYSAFLHVGALTYLRETIMFSLSGALIQLIASWMIAYRMKKERKSAD